MVCNEGVHEGVPVLLVIIDAVVEALLHIAQDPGSTLRDFTLKLGCSKERDIWLSYLRTRFPYIINTIATDDFGQGISGNDTGFSE